MSGRKALIAATLVGVVALLGWVGMDKPYRLEAIGQPADQAALAHRDSAYSSITWVASPSENYLQLRFFDRVEGGVCLKPTWDDLATLGRTTPSLAHLVPTAPVPAAPADAMWPHSWTPNPGALANSPYVRLFPVGVLMNQRLMEAAQGDRLAATPRILVVGLGSGIGIATLAYHFPGAAITVVDIDQAVIDLVRGHYPMLAWLAQQKRADGEPRLRFMAQDARKYIHYDATREARYDLVILDAYTSGSTIPPHLMTLDFFRECAAILGDGGLVLANVIGNVSASGAGDKSLVLGGAIRSLRAAGLPHLWNFPVLSTNDSLGTVDAGRQRNNILIAGRAPLDPRSAAAGWERLSRFTLVPELPLGTYTSSSYLLISEGRRMYTSAALPAELLDRALPNLRGRLAERRLTPDAIQNPTFADGSDRSLVEEAVRALRVLAAKEGLTLPEGWDERGDADAIRRTDTDWVQTARETFRTSVATARDATKWSGEALTGDVEQGERPYIAEPTWLIPDAPLFTDQRPNADIYNR